MKMVLGLPLAWKCPRQAFRAQAKSYALAFLYRRYGQSGQNVNNKAIPDDRVARSNTRPKYLTLHLPRFSMLILLFGRLLNMFRVLEIGMSDCQCG